MIEVLKRERSFTFSLESMGCKANFADSHILRKRLEDLGGEYVKKNPDVFILNSCTVTDKASRNAIALVKRSLAPLSVFTGCLAEVSPNLLHHFPQKKLILARNSAKAELSKHIAKTISCLKRGESISSEILKGNRSLWHKEIDDEKNISNRSTRTRAFLKVQDGCNQFCSYCIIPLARGRSRSLSIERVLEEVHTLREKGVKELVLTAIHAGDYRDKKSNFFSLVRNILEKTDMPRVRLTSLDPEEINEELYSLMKSYPRLCKHFHISMQSMSSSVLRDMKRNYDASRAEDCLWEIQESFPEAFVGMDMIAGFPTEGEKEYVETMTRLKRSPWTALHVFPYSKRKFTFATKMLEKAIWREEEESKRQRAFEMRCLSKEHLLKSLEKKKGKVLEVLTEKTPYLWKGKKYSHGLSRSYYRVLVGAFEDFSSNKLLRVQVKGLVDGKALLARV